MIVRVALMICFLVLGLVACDQAPRGGDRYLAHCQDIERKMAKRFATEFEETGQRRWQRDEVEFVTLFFLAGETHGSKVRHWVKCVYEPAPPAVKTKTLHADRIELDGTGLPAPEVMLINSSVGMLRHHRFSR